MNTWRNKPMISSNKPTEEELRDMIDKGMTLYKISRKYGTTIPVIFQLEKEYGIRSQYDSLKRNYSISKEDLISMYIDEHMAQWQIAEELGCSQYHIHDMMKYYDIPIRGRGKYTPHQRSLLHDNIVKMYEGGMTAYEIAEEVGYTIFNVYRILHERGVQTRLGGKYTAHQRASKADEIMQRYNNGETTYEIAEEVGYTIFNVYRILHERGVQTRVPNGTITYQEMALITDDKLQECIDKGMNQHQIAEYFGVCDATIFNMAEKFGIPGMVNGSRCTTTEYINWRDEVLIRDNYTCQLCGSPERPEVHHIYKYSDYPDRRYDIDNGVVLCHWCHQKVTGHESEYIVELEDIVLRDRGIGDDIEHGIDYIDYLARKFDQKGVDIFGGELPTHEYTSIPKEE